MPAFFDNQDKPVICILIQIFQELNILYTDLYMDHNLINLLPLKKEKKIKGLHEIHTARKFLSFTFFFAVK